MFIELLSTKSEIRRSPTSDLSTFKYCHEDQRTDRQTRGIRDFGRFLIYGLYFTPSRLTMTIIHVDKVVGDPSIHHSFRQCDLCYVSWSFLIKLKCYEADEEYLVRLDRGGCHPVPFHNILVNGTIAAWACCHGDNHRHGWSMEWDRPLWRSNTCHSSTNNHRGSSSPKQAVVTLLFFPACGSPKDLDVGLVMQFGASPKCSTWHWWRGWWLSILGQGRCASVWQAYCGADGRSGLDGTLLWGSLYRCNSSSSCWFIVQLHQPQQAWKCSVLEHLWDCQEGMKCDKCHFEWWES
jgi:hypothetical protein